MREAFKFIKRNVGESDNSLIGAEVGVRKGDNIVKVANCSFIKRLYLIDHYLPHVESSGVEVTLEQQRTFYAQMFNNLHPYVNKVVFVSVPSDFASTLFSDNYFDFVYIDGGHSYENVTNDLNFWFHKVRKGGVLCGHDFNNKCTPEVAEAVRDFSKSSTLYVLDDLDWAIIK